MELARFELLHHAFFLFARQTAVQQAHAELGKNVVRELFIHPLSGAQLQLVGLLDQGVDHVGLLAAPDLGADELEGARAVLLAQEPRLDGRAVRRKLVDHGIVKVAVERERERARNRRGGHHQDVRSRPLANQLVALQHAEAVLLVHHHQAEPRELHVAFDQRVRAHHEVHDARGDALLEFRFLARLARAGQHVNLVGQGPQQLFDVEIVLHGEDFRGGHERHLAAALDRHDRRLDSDDGLSGPHVPLEKAVHGMGRAHVVHDFLQRSLLGRGRMKRQDFLDRLADIFRNPGLDPRHGLCFPALQGEAGANVEKLLENQAYLRGRPKLAKIFETLARSISLFFTRTDSGRHSGICRPREASAPQTSRRRTRDPSVPTDW